MEGRKKTEMTKNIKNTEVCNLITNLFHISNKSGNAFRNRIITYRKHIDLQFSSLLKAQTLTVAPKIIM
jgi:hypothetical protein